MVTCDACGVASAKRVFIVDNVLLRFCNHHATEHAEGLSEYDEIILEES